MSRFESKEWTMHKLLLPRFDNKDWKEMVHTELSSKHEIDSKKYKTGDIMTLAAQLLELIAELPCTLQSWS